MSNGIKEELQRLSDLQEYGIAYEAADKGFENLARLAAQICDAPFAQINFVEEESLHVKASYGVDLKVIPRETTFCHYTIREEQGLLVKDASLDERFNRFPFVNGDPGIRFYAGKNVKSQSGKNIGTICVLGIEPKTLTADQLDALDTLAGEVESRLELHLKNRKLEETKAFLESAVDALLVIDQQSLNIVQASTRLGELCPVFDAIHDQTSVYDLFKDRKLMAKLISGNEATRNEFEHTVSLKNSAGEIIYLQLNGSLKKSSWYLSARDITARKEYELALKNEKELSEAIINSLPVNFFMYDAKGNAISWNKNSTHTTGYTDQEMAEMNPLDFFNEPCRSEVNDFIQMVHREGAGTTEAELITKSGEELPYVFSARSFKRDGKTYLIGTGQEVMELKRNQQKLEGLLSQKEVLIQEVHHRVKNNLAVISAFLQLEELMSEVPEVRKTLAANHMRVKTMSIIHEDLYSFNKVHKVNFGRYMDRLISTILDKRSTSHPDITIHGDISEVELNLNQAVPLALVINELVHNAYEFAFEGRPGGSIEIELKEEAENIYLRITDDGVGLPDNFVLERSPTLGATLVSTLSEQINSDIEIKSERGEGTEYRLNFNRQKHSRGSSAHMAVV